uniref:Retrovirus-related Pol polyprotein from transposon TNT 1-94 n=1 Tax=Tanacetum cinerariifolium TaxID=118510 RepID=A0A6L2MHV2_TANCI|nr:retrovirus-related Pol polyprotein from transposon TNT 1-94 [Tanacetum cinerariifolium]
MQTQTSNTLHNAIMEADSKDHPPMLATGNYVQWKSRINRYIDTKPNQELIHYCLTNPPYELGWKDKEISISEGSPITRTKRFQETYKNVLEEIRDQLNAEAEAVQIILTEIDNDIYSIVDACLNTCEIWKAIERLKQVESINVQDLETKLYWEFAKFTSQDGESLKSYYSRSQQAATRNRGKAIVNSPQPIYDQEPAMVAEDDETSNQDNSPRINRSVGYENQRTGNVAGARETKPKRPKDAAYHKEKMLLCKQEEAGIQLNAKQADWRDDTDDDELEDQELEAHYMYMAQLQEVSLDAADSGPIFDDEPLQQVSNDDHYNVFAMESGHPEQFKSVHDTYPIDQDAHNVLIEQLKDEIEDFKNKNKSLESSNNHFKEANNKLSETNNLLYIDFKKSEAELARRNSREYASQMEIECAKKETQIKLYKTHEDKELEKVIALENKVKVLDNTVYKTGQSVQTMNMLNNKCQTSFAKPEFLKKAQRANPRLFDIVDVLGIAMVAVVGMGYNRLRVVCLLAAEAGRGSCRHISECQKPKKAKDAAYHKEKMLLCKQEEARIQLNAEQADWRDDTDDDGLEDQELEAHYMYMAQLQEVSPDVADSGPIFDDETLQKVSNDDHYNVFAIESVHHEQSKSVHYTYHIEQDAQSVNIDSLDMDYDRDEIDQNADDNDLAKEHELLASLIEKLKCEIYESKNRNKFLDTSNKVLIEKLKARRDCPIHRRLWVLKAHDEKSQASNLNFDTINMLSKNDIVVGLPKLTFIKDHLCFSYELGKAKRKSFHTKLNSSSKRRLQLLYMDLCGPMRVASINGKIYVLVIVDDYSRYTWTHFLRSKDETPEVLIDFLRLVQRGLQAQARIVQTDKGMEFLNQNLHAYFAAEGIHHQTSVAQTPKQNVVVERRNRTLVEAARTMLSAAKVPLFFWAEAIATACFTQNRSLVIPHHEKTPYHIINDRKPSVKFFYIFGSICYIVRDGENLDKIKEKDQTKYHSKVGALMYLTASRPDIMHATCYCARYQAQPTEKHLTAVKRIFQCLKDTIHMGLWYPKDTSFELTTFLDLDHAGCLDSCKSTSGGIQFLGGDKLVSWSSKKQDCTSMSSTEAEYVSLSVCCTQVIWMKTQLTDYGFHFDKIPMYCDSKVAIAISCNPVQHSRTKHIDARYHFIKEKVEKGIIELFFVRTEYQFVDLFTKALPEERFKYLVRRLGMRCLTLAELKALANEST